MPLNTNSFFDEFFSTNLIATVKKKILKEINLTQRKTDDKGSTWHMK